MILVVFISMIMYAFVRKINLLDFIIFVGVECLIIVLVIWLYSKIKK
jgi:hypothetical protein